MLNNTVSHRDNQDKSPDDEQNQKEDWKKNYHTARLIFGLLIMLLTDAVREGDPKRLLICIKVALPILYTNHRVKYSYVVLLFLAKLYAILPNGMAFDLIHNRFFNSSGKPGGNIPLDLRMEHLNKLLKIALRQLGSNINESSAQRIAKGLEGLEDLVKNIHRDCSLPNQPGYHSSSHLRETVTIILNDLISEKVFFHHEGRQYKVFQKFSSDLLRKLDHRDFCHWARRLFNTWEAMYY